MKSMIRVVLIDPVGDSRQALQRLLGGINSVWLAEACSSYKAAAGAVAENAPDLVLIAIDADPEQAVGVIQAIARSNPSSVILPASRARDGDLILRLIRAGAREFLTLPAELDELLGAIERLVPAGPDAGASARRRGQVIAVAGAAGGVGCTTLAVNLAAAMARDPERSVVLVDFDLLLGSIDTCLDIMPDHTLLEVAQSIDRLDLTLLKRSMTRHSSGLFVLPHPIAMEDVARIEPEALRRVIRLLTAAFDTVVIDASKGLQATDIVAFEMAETILLVLQLELTCLRNTARLLQLFRQQFEGLAEKVRVVVNRSIDSVSEIGLKKAEEVLNMPIAWQIPNSSREVIAARAKGVTLDVESPNCRAHRAIASIARELSPGPPEKADGKPRRGRFAALFF